MSIIKGCFVSELVALDKADDDGCLGYCRHDKTDHWRDSVWIGLAGPIASAIHEGRDGWKTFRLGDFDDYNKAMNLYLDFLKPPLPRALEKIIGEDVSYTAELVLDGFYLPNISAPLKGKLTRFCKQHQRAMEFAGDLLRQEVKAIRETIENSPYFMPMTYAIASELNRVSRMDTRALLTLFKSLSSQETERLSNSAPHRPGDQQ
ncbi:hypothetical protein COO20_10840 [Thalassospira marina]|uniref:Uncharacterized protein n=2 Tax=Thalassospira marina TaxID=2048283 RepID=A0A2N3KU23_9PROT|nr:hypothetical protein COO20_10840 [Thalassospira marina]